MASDPRTNRRVRPRTALWASLALLLSASLVLAQAPIPQTPAQPGQQPAALPPSPGMSSAGYVLGPGDSIRVTVWTGNDYLEQTLTLAGDGTVMVPFFVNKLVPAAGLTAIQLRELIQSNLQKVFLNPLVQVIGLSFESKRASLMGEVASTGYFPIDAQTSILNFVLQHGGFGPKANLSEVQVTRADGQKLRVNIYEIVIKGDKTQDVALKPNDLVYVPSLELIGNKYFMLGEVRSPGLLFSPEPLTLLDAIAKSGTLTQAAQAKHVFVIRVKPEGGSDVKDIRFFDLYRKGDLTTNVMLKSGDIVYVPRSPLTRVADVLNAIIPVTSFVRDLAYLGTLFTQ